MALAATYSDVRVTEGIPSLYTLTVHLVLHDDVLVKDVIDQDFSEEYSESQTNLVTVRLKLGQKMQAAINQYKAGVTLVSQVNRDAAITWWNENITI